MKLLPGTTEDDIKKALAAIDKEVMGASEATLATPWSTEGGSPELPYEFVVANETYDIWAFGCMLYHMVTGSQLFGCDRDDDLATADGMFDVLCWNEERRATKMEAVGDDLAKSVLVKILQKDPKKRLQTMEDVLAEDFFDLKKNMQLEDLASRIDGGFDKVLDNQASQTALLEHIEATTTETLMNTHKIIELSYEMKDQMAKATSTILKGIFEATEVTTPTCFVILPYELQEQDVYNEQLGRTEKILRAAGDGVEKAKKFMNQLDALEGHTQDAMEKYEEMVGSDDPLEAAKSFGKKLFDGAMGNLKEKMLNKAEEIFDAKRSQDLWFYLVDEYTGEPVKGGVYPIKITTQSDLCKKALPMMKLGMKAVTVFNGAAGVANMLGYPVPHVPSSLTKMANNAINAADQPSSVAEFSVVQEVVDGASAGDGKQSGPKRGNALRQFMKFLEKHDPEKDYAGLARVCQEKDGDAIAIWTTEEGKTKLEHDQIRKSTSAEEKAKYDQLLKQKMEKRKGNSPSKRARDEARKKLGLLDEDGKLATEKEFKFEEGSPMAKTPSRHGTLEPLENSPFKARNEEEINHLEELTKTVEDLAAMKVTGEVLEGELTYKMKKSTLLGLSSANVDVVVTGKIRGDGIFTYGDYYIDLVSRDLPVRVGDSPKDFTIGKGKSEVSFTVKDNHTAEEWKKALKSFDVDGNFSKKFSQRKEAVIKKIDVMKKQVMLSHEESSKLLLDMVADSEEEDEEEGEGEPIDGIGEGEGDVVALDPHPIKTHNDKKKLDEVFEKAESSADEVTTEAPAAIVEAAPAAIVEAAPAAIVEAAPAAIVEAAPAAIVEAAPAAVADAPAVVKKSKKSKKSKMSKMSKMSKESKADE